MKNKDWSTNDRSELISLIEDHYKQDQTLKLTLAKVWEENIRFIEGDQYIRYSNVTHNYEPIPDRVDRDYIPRGNDNQLFVRTDICRANLTRQNPIFDISSNSTDPIDLKEAKVALCVHSARVESDHDYIVNGDCADWAVATGNAFIETLWCPTSKIPVIEADGKQSIDPDGNPLMASLGDVVRISVPPFKIAPDQQATSIEDASVIMKYSVELTKDVKEWYNISAPGYTGEAETLVDEQVDNSSILKIVNNLKTSFKDTRRPLIENSVVLKLVYVKPSEKLPFGRFCAYANNKLLFDAESEYAKISIKKWHPFDHFRYKTMPGKFWGVTPTTQGVKLQRAINAIDSMVALHRQTMALGQWLIPINSIADGQLAGRVGLKIPYKPGLGGAKPEKIPGTRIGDDIFRERETKVLALDTLFGVTDVMKGMNSSGDSGVTLELAREMSFSRFNPMYERWEKFLESSSELRLNLIAKKQSQDIPTFTKILKNKLRVLTGIDIQNFVGSQINNATNIKIQAGSTVPKSNAAKLSNLMKFGEAGLLGDLVNDPLRNQMFLAEFGIDNFKTEQNVDFEKAKYQLSCIELGMPNMVDIREEDDERIHIGYLLSKLKDPEWYSSRNAQIIKMAWDLVAAYKNMGNKKQSDSEAKQRVMRDENAYVQAVVNHGGPGKDPPSVDLFPTSMESQAQIMNQNSAQQKGVN